MSQTNGNKSFMLLLRGGKSMADMTPQEAQECIGKYFKWMEQLQQQGVYKSGEPLQDAGKVLSGPGGRTVTDGPYVEGKEEVGGFFMITAGNLNEAAKIAQGCPIFDNQGNVEVREIAVIPQP